MALKLNSTLFALGLLVTSQQAAANILVSFNESAPKDWFSISNQGACTVTNMQLQIDLRNTVGKLIFDTTALGEGVEVFQPFEVREGNIQLASSDSVKDGDKSLTITISDLAVGESASFTIDVDDTLTNSELGMIRVSDAEISGGKLVLSIGDAAAVTGNFDSKGETILPSPACN